ncbi:Protein trichome birefringence-like 13, partial [Dionaea muscipula]
MNKKENADEISKWRWKPKMCDLPVLDPVQFLLRYRDTSIGTRFSQFTTAFHFRSIFG